MNLAAITAITVSFVGLINFHNVVDGTGGKVIAPLAMTSVSYATESLRPHAAGILIEGVAPSASAATQCTSVGGVLSGTAPERLICKVTPITSGKVVKLPKPLPTKTDDFSIQGHFDIPKLKTTLCTAMGDLKDGYDSDVHKYAVLVDLKNGKLDACRSGQAWTSTLTLSNSDGKLEIGSGQVMLEQDATVTISNVGEASENQKEHFLWYYRMYESPTSCDDLPAEGTASGCGTARMHDHLDTATGIGCSNTQYP